MNVCSFADQKLHIVETPPLDGDMESRLACRMHKKNGLF